MLSEKAQLILKTYKEIINKKGGELPVYGDFPKEIISKDSIRRAFGGITKLHEFVHNETKVEDPSAPEAIPSKEIFAKTESADTAKKNRFIITTAVGGARAHKGFLGAIDNWCERHDAEVIIMPCEDVTNSFENETAWFDPVFTDSKYLFVTKDTKLNSNCTLCHIQISAKQIKPTTGISRIGIRNGGSYIFAAPKQFLDYYPSGNSKTKNYSVMTTGACTESNYFSNRYVSKRLSYIADHDHVIGALIVEIENEQIFHFRQIQADSDGSFTDLGTTYYPDGEISKNIPCAIVFGDIHCAQLDTKAFNSFENDIAENLNIEYRVFHDVFDGISVNPHHDTIGSQAKNWKRDLAEELTDVFNFIEGSSKRSPVYIVQSNHDEFLDRYLMAGQYVKDAHNHRTALGIACDMFDYPDEPLLKLASERVVGKKYSPTVNFLKRSSSLLFGGVELAAHGDLGLNGAKSSMQSLEKIYGRCVVAHAHSASILRSVFRVGVMGNLDMGYNRGPSSWTQTNAIVYDNGQVQLLNYIDGKWKI